MPFPRIEEREIIADHETGSVKVKYIINPGKRAFWGKPVFKGLENVEQALLENLVPWGQGEPYDPDQLDTYYSDLMGLGLFSMIKINEGNISDDNRLRPEIEVSERKHKSIEIGLNYYTDEGPGAKLLWENRNLMGRGENIGFIFNLSRYLTSSTVTFKKPFFLAQKQALRLSVQKKQEDPDAYTSDSYLSSLFLDREFAGDLKISAGLVFKYSKITQINVEDKFRLLYLPLIFGLDKSNDLLDP